MGLVYICTGCAGLFALILLAKGEVCGAFAVLGVCLLLGKMASVGGG